MRAPRLAGFVLALSLTAPAAVAALAVASLMDRYITLERLPVFSEEDSTDEAIAQRHAEVMRVPLIEALLPVLLHVLLISGDTVVGALKPADTGPTRNSIPDPASGPAK